MEYVALDFETANGGRDSACSIGIVTVSDGKIIDEYYHLIRPQDLWFDSYNIAIHGITPDMVENEPTFKELWPDILNRLNGKQVIAHYAQFDISVLRNTLDSYDIPYPEFKYLCTWSLSKKAMPGLISYKLDSLAEKLNFNFLHHNALEDAKACSAIMQNILQKIPCNDFDTLAKALEICCGKLYNNGYSPCHTLKKNTNKDLASILPTNGNIDESHYFYGKKIAFTGTLLSMPRKDAVQEIVNKGALFEKSVTKATNILVFGYQDPKKFAEHATCSSKFQKAMKLLESGSNIEILNEDDFIKILQS